MTTPGPSPALLEVARRLAASPRPHLWILAVAPRLTADSGAALVHALPPHAPTEGRSPSDRWTYLVRWAARWPRLGVADIGSDVGEVLDATESPVWATRHYGIPRVTVLLDATDCGRSVADALCRAAGRAGLPVLEATLGAPQLGTPQAADEVLRMPALESRGAIRAAAGRLVLADADWADGLAGHIARGDEIEAGPERALGVALWYAMRATGDREPPAATVLTDSERDSSLAWERDWVLGVRR